MSNVKDLKNFKIYGNPWYIAIGISAIILLAAYLGVLGTDFACFFGSAALLHFKLIPAAYVDSVNNFIGGDMDFLNLFIIIILITGSVLSLEKDILLKSFAGYLPALLGGLARDDEKATPSIKDMGAALVLGMV